MLKVPIVESYLRIKLNLNVWASVRIHDKMAAFWFFFQNWLKSGFFWGINLQLHKNVRYFLLIICTIYAKDKKARVDYGYANVFFTIYGLLKMNFLSNFKITFAKSVMKKWPFLWQVFKVIIEFYYLPKFCFAISKLKRNQILNFSNFFNIHKCLM